MEACRQGLLLKVHDLSQEQPAAGGHTDVSAITNHMVELPRLEAAVPLAYRSLICHKDVLESCRVQGLLDVGQSSDGTVWLWLTPAGLQSVTQ